MATSDQELSPPGLIWNVKPLEISTETTVIQTTIYPGCDHSSPSGVTLPWMLCTVFAFLWIWHVWKFRHLYIAYFRNVFAHFLAENGRFAIEVRINAWMNNELVSTCSLGLCGAPPHEHALSAEAVRTSTLPSVSEGHPTDLLGIELPPIDGVGESGALDSTLVEVVIQ